MHAMILAGGLSHERDVSIRSGRRVHDALRGSLDRVSLQDVDTELIPSLRFGGVDVVWPLLHGASGEDGSLQALLELVGVPYVGTTSKSARVAWNKAVAKAVLGRSGISTPDYVTLPQSLFREVGAEHVLDLIVARFELPVVVKPARGGSALGISVVHKREDLARAMVHCFAYGDTALVERAVEGIEVAMSVLGTGDDARALPGVEVVVDGEYDYDARYNPGRCEYFAPARLTDEQSRIASETALLVHRTMDLRDVSRVDMILDSEGRAQVIDINVAPGMTETSLLPQAAEAAGLDLPTVYRELVETAAARGPVTAT
ncbi:D-alanine--D-alanine ligase [Demequina sp. SYSU T00039]|uniref:D-alanine--D-alanine ligase n=1 Tax=Demequina lignilytica TaxID=3051663 RepID=A0AAW7M8D0_9MICO|nr:MULTISPECIES: D-alanine--D-alanine ligase [unclassified Demequina]MDN4477816.1 D-alanine--D-alanine ligase [Demequina sp. SYSU T00039-1]MDN4487725.1 D-alanine--D-alanine ligase [Demequina sp. SYSU T00039]MDN4490892.1 D-alanine--D-alanine ligase [Demequina sp. SYSU T00068]